MRKLSNIWERRPRNPNALRFWVEGGVIPLCGFGSILILVRSPRFCPLGLPNNRYQRLGLRLGRVQFDPYIEKYSLTPISKVFLMVVSGKHVLYKCERRYKWEVISNVLGFENASARGGVYQCGRLSLEGEIGRYSSVSLSLTLSKNEKVEQHIRKKTHKPNALRFWVESGVIPSYGFGSVLILMRSPRFCPLELPIKWLQSRRFIVVTGSYKCSLIPISKVFLTEVSGKRIPFKCLFKCVNEVRIICD